MPELPEVETICRQLRKLIVGRKIKNVEVKLPKIVRGSLADFLRAVKGSKVQDINRRAKLLVFKLDSGRSLLLHLKMTGQLIFNGRPEKHTHAVFSFADGSCLLFNDMRQFGYIKLIRTAMLEDFFVKEKIGPEPLAESFSLTDFKVRLIKKPKAKIKQFLMDQKNLAGIGNIYSDEILFLAGVHPLRVAALLKYNEIKKIYLGIRKILPEAIKLKGASAENYVDAFGRQGGFWSKLKVYGREGENCPKCKRKIVRIKIGGRSAHFCPICQK